MDDEGPHQHAPHRTGHRSLDLVLGLCAFAISLISLGVAIHHGRTMEKLVASNSFPNIDVEQGNYADLADGNGSRKAIYFSLVNTGIGPARVHTLELFHGGHPVRNFAELLALCCTDPAPTPLPMLNYWYAGDVRGSMLVAGRPLQLIAWPANEEDPRWERLNAVRETLSVRVCYCSVFDECFVRDSSTPEPERVERCPLPPVPFAAR